MLSGLIDEKFQLGRFLSKDGSSEVYEATQVKLDRTVSIKLLGEGHDEDAVKRFQREAEALARLNHPSIVFVLDFGLHEGRPYIVREAVEGETLEARLQAGKVFTPEEAVPILVEVVSALEHAHEHQVIHRDLRPTNILLHQDGRVRVTDFDLALVTDAEALTAPGTIIGRSWYMSPEQVRGESADARTDIYGLGVVAHRMLTGRFPFHEPTLEAMLTRQQHEAPTPLAEQLDVEPEAASLLVAVDRMLAHDREARFPSANWVANALDRASADLALPEATEAVRSLDGAEPPPLPAPASTAFGPAATSPGVAGGAFDPPAPSDEHSVDAWAVDPDEPPSRAEEPDVTPTGGRFKAAAVLLYLAALAAVTLTFAVQQPDAAREARRMVRARQAPQLVEQLGRLAGSADAEASLIAAHGHALVHVRSPHEAIAEFERAAQRDPSALKAADIAALVRYLGLPSNDTLAAEQILRSLGPRANGALLRAYQAENDPFLRCRIGALLGREGEAQEACTQALKSPSCVERAIIKKQLGRSDTTATSTSADCGA